MLTANESLVACKIGYCFCNDSFIRIFFFSQLLFVGKFSFITGAAAAAVAAAADVDIDHSLTPNSTTFKMSFLFFSVVVFFPFVHLPIRALLTLPTNFTR